MRKIVGIGRSALKHGQDPISAVSAALNTLVGGPQVSDVAPEKTSWDFVTFREQFKKSPPSHLRNETVNGYYRALSREQVGESVYQRRLVDITPANIRALRAAILGRGKERQAQLTMQAMRTALEWASDPTRSHLSGITEENNPMLEVQTRRNRAKRKPTQEDALAAAQLIKVDKELNVIIEDPSLPSMLDVGKLLIFLFDTPEFGLVRRAALLLLIYSVQRRTTVAAAVTRALVGIAGRSLAFWVLHGGTTKSGRLHILPIATKAWKIVEEWKESAESAIEWLFPGMPTRRKPKADGHIHPRTVTEWMYEAWIQAGCSRRYNAHVIRKVFGTYLSQRSISKASRKLILDHAEGRGSDVTEVHYNFDPRLPEKESVMRAWVEFLDECMSMVRDRGALQPGSHASIIDKRMRTVIHDPARRDILFDASVPQNESRSAPGLNSIANKQPPIEADRLQKLRENLTARLNLDHAIERARRKGGGVSEQ